jgi:hypothetical protein
MDEARPDDRLAALAYVVRDAVLTSKRLSARDREAAARALAELVEAARRAERYEAALLTIARSHDDDLERPREAVWRVKALASRALGSAARPPGDGGVRILAEPSVSRPGGQGNSAGNLG